ncbi:MAG: hypothetical protein EPO20_15125 [Betaproteobacteria bacterium]|nr:MAG: hypothetical protein EPO20_15125 [Betaproteobacteria bacterium]
MTNSLNTQATAALGNPETRAAANVLRFPLRGWAVRQGTLCAHFFFQSQGRTLSACGGVERPDKYVPQQLRPLQAGKSRCASCERMLERWRRYSSWKPAA